VLVKLDRIQHKTIHILNYEIKNRHLLTFMKFRYHLRNSHVLLDDGLHGSKLSASRIIKIRSTKMQVT
jgi:hypothetical protein